MNLYFNTNNPASKCNWVMDALQVGWSDTNPVYNRDSIDLVPSHLWGIILNNKQVIDTLTANNIDWYFWDMPYYGRWGVSDNYYWRCSKNSYHYSRTKDYPSDRFNLWNIIPKNKPEGSKILICPSSETMTQIATGLNVKTWVAATIDEVRKYSDRPIDIRYKPRKNGTSGPAVADVPFEIQARDAHCVITSVSLCAVEAQLMGISTVCHASSFAADISISIEEIENCKTADTAQWFYNLAYSQFTPNEISSGAAYRIINDY